MRQTHRNTLPGRMARLTTVALAALVVVLGVLAVSPDTHRWLHAHDADAAHAGHAAAAHGGCPGHSHDDARPESEEGCVVELFAQGIEGGSVFVAWTAGWRVLDGFSVRSREELLLSPPRFLWQPERGPPVRI